MTQMSRPRRPPRAEFMGNPARTLAGSPLARALHAHAFAVRALVLSLLAGGCVIPPSLSSNTTDGGVNSPPAILSVSSDQQQLVEPGPVLFEQNTTSSLIVKVRDTDVSDTLYVRVFVDYHFPDATPARAACTATAAKSADRTASCSLAGLCETADVGVQRGMTVVVFDREPQDTGTPLYQAMPPDGLSTDRFFYLQCQPPSP